ncbi:UDP-N-acetylmuramoyl-L-alanyl-D-glutamate--2,6-diaminopimelate ligase [Corynebacterium poyangense]|uniref:UDP-N-acetylmuramoyl-L-alanyl-D-glutamate--2,6-diaminopimelate ligase n=1 Tax=Corynebacterium poyangense TaxID=2684405 RepID=A0A7H0SPT8_9CORY|nr:UDP-N-acetylmuramoyl-L-alanyl-D-glutamate--2,6-diaminopimelate ligase [Corynebacterium poyangense]QNQ90563.1 UDP-N-acetylmuramoyl-L-alanyl-D-glutamate--2,6-diaminopimelate ligase [Corynebacterium poyangense]
MATKLSTLVDLAGGRLENADRSQDLLIHDIGLDSSRLPEGGLFAALPGTRTHGARYAHNTPAAAILSDETGAKILREQGDTRPVIIVEDVRAILGVLAAEIYQHPSREFTLIGITGTSGKTTTSYLLEAGLRKAGCSVGLIGTTGTRINGNPVDTPLTTPEAPMLQHLFRHMADSGVTHVVMEVSSHALALGRVDGSAFDVAVFSNLSQDHLDFHPTMEDYFEAKARFFHPASSVRAQHSIICVDDDWGQRMADIAIDPLRVSGGPQHHEANIWVSDVEVEPQGGQNFLLHLGAQELPVHMPLPGAFNITNAALALATAATVGADVAAVASGIAEVAVPGRMERIDQGQDFIAVVDYAHKPAAVAAVLDTLRKQTEKRIGIVLGAGGDRDKAKRPMMGEAAAQRADLVIISDDNPRTEDPATIREAVAAGARQVHQGAEIRIIGDRHKAIRELVAWAQPGDAVIVAGKGHETGQLIGTTTHHFDDREEMRTALELRGFQAATGKED